MADKITDLPGLSEWGKYNGVDVNGKHYSPEQVSRDEGLSEYVMGNTKTVYEAFGGGYTVDPYKAVSSITLDSKTGNIVIKAPKTLTDTPEFQKMYPTDVLKQYSQAYKANQDYKVPYTELDKNGKEVSTEITIPEFVQKLNNSLVKENGFLDNARKAEEQRKKYNYRYNSKANNLSLEQVQKTLDFGKYVYIPEFLLNGQFSSLRDKVDDDGRISIEEFRKAYYNRDNIGRQELAELNAQIDSALSYSDWGDDTYEDEEGNIVVNPVSAEQMARALNLKNYINSSDPDAEWYQQVGDNVVSLGVNAAYGCTRVFANIANLGETVMTAGQGHGAQEYIVNMDASVQRWNEENALVNDATTVVSWLGQIGGAILGTVGVTMATGAAIGAAEKGLSAYVSGKAAAAEAVFNMGPSAQAALTAETMNSILSSAETVSIGARVMLKAASIAQKVACAKGVVDAFKNTHQITGFVVDFLVDTVHDALLYDSVSLRQALEASDQETRDFWLGQLADNGKWWMGMAAAKGAFKGFGKAGKAINQTNLGQKLNAYTTKYVNKLAANVGDKKAALKDKVAGGDLVRTLEEKLKKATSDNKSKKARRIANKIEQTKWNEMLREARRELGNVELDSKSITALADDSAKKFVESVNAVKAIENSIDNYNRNIFFKRQEMLGVQRDPATGKNIFINPELGGANLRVTDYYLKLSNLGAKYNLKAADQSLISQEMIDYMVGSYHRDILRAFADSKSSNAARASDALAIVNKNVITAKEALPEEIVKFIDENRSAYTDFYAALNGYGKAKGLVDVEKIIGYEENAIWANNGYMPIKVDADKVEGKWISEDGMVHATLEQELRHHKFLESEGQHYIDPELVRQTRINNMARGENNLSIMKAYSQLESATNVVKVSGDESAYASKITAGRTALEKAINSAKSSFAESTPFVIGKADNVKKTIKRGVAYTDSLRQDAMSQFSLSDTQDILREKGLITDDYPYLTSTVTEDGYRDWYNSQPETVKNYLAQQYDKYGFEYDANGGTFDNLLSVIQSSGDDFEAGLQRAYLMGDDDFLNSNLMKQAIKAQEDGKSIFYNNVVAEWALNRLRRIKSIDADEVGSMLTGVIRKDIEDYVAAIMEDSSARATINAMAKTTNGSALNARYYSLQQLLSNPKVAEDSLDAQIDSAVKGQGLITDDVDKIKSIAHSMFDDIAKNELSDAASSLRTVNSELLNNTDIFKEVDEINKKIKLADESIKSKDTNMVMYLDEQGRQVYAETDPTFASLFNYRYRMDKGEASALAKFNAATSKLFRYGTTSVNLASFGNQLFRDFGNALMVGGAWRTIKSNADNLVDVFGKNIVDQIKRFDPSGYEIKQIEKIAEQGNMTIEQAAVSRELSRGAAISPSTTERTLYRDFMREAYASNKDALITKAKTQLQEIVDKYNPEDLLNGRRENYLRNRVFANTYNECISNGYTLEQARTFAEFAMNNATTNFSRQLYHMQAIADSTPYFRAGINGTKSFWRMWSLDPVGITGRIMGGLILPTIYLTGMSVSDPESREIYKNIPEYQKENSLVFVVNGSVISVPIPQEMSSIVAPFRQFTEYLWNANKNDFWELMMNDALGYSPIDLQGFSTIDMNTMMSDPTITDRINRGFARVFSTMAPVGIKSLYILATRTDPYTGKNINDPSYTYWDEGRGEVVTMDYTQNEFAKWFSKSFGGKIGMSSSLAEKIISGLFGTTGANVLSDVTALCSSGIEGGIKETVTNIGTQLGKPFSVNVYNLADSAWRQSVQQLTAEKDAIMASDEWKTLNSQLSQEKDPVKRNKIFSERQNLVNDYQQKVVSTVKRLQSEYGGTYDRTKFAATIQLLNFATDPAYQSGSQYSSDIASDNYWDGRNDAIHTMERFGIVGSNDMSIFGYLATNRDGDIVVKYNSPVAILDLENSWKSAKNVHAANISAAIDSAKLWDKKKEMQSQVDAIYDKKKLSNSDYDAIDAIYVNWNADVMKTIAPYIERYTPEAAINNTEVMDYLRNLIKVPGDYKKDRYGKYVTNTKLGEGSANDAYIESYIKKIFKVNDTGWSGGKNYSGRESLGGAK